MNESIVISSKSLWSWTETVANHEYDVSCFCMLFIMTDIEAYCDWEYDSSSYTQDSDQEGSFPLFLDESEF